MTACDEEFRNAAQGYNNASIYLNHSSTNSGTGQSSGTAAPSSSATQKGGARPKISTGATKPASAPPVERKVLATMSITKHGKIDSPSDILLSIILSVVQRCDQNGWKGGNILLREPSDGAFFSVKTEGNYRQKMMQKLGDEKHWYIWSNILEGNEDDHSRLVKYLESKWTADPDGNMARHALFLGTTSCRSSSPGFIGHEFKHSSDEGYTVKFEDMNRRFGALKQTHIEVYSHTPRLKALHDYLCDINEEYQSQWDILKNDYDNADFDQRLQKFFKTFDPSGFMPLKQNQAVSFQFPTIQFGFRVGNEDSMIAYRNDEGSTHHKFVTDKHDVEPVVFDAQIREKFENLLRVLAEKCTRGDGNGRGGGTNRGRARGGGTNRGGARGGGTNRGRGERGC